MASRALLILALTAISLLGGVQSITFTVTNKCSFTIWPGTLNNPDHPLLSSTGFELASGASSSLDVPSSWAGRFWARSQCSTDPSGKFTCGTGDCGSGQISCNGQGAIPPASLVEFTINGDGGKDFYDISLVDGFNLPVSATPQGEGCSPTSCPANVNAICPPELGVKGSDGSVIACKSACLAFKEPKYCCTGEFSSGPDKCPPTNYSTIFKKQCPQAYSYAFDDKSSTFTCPTGSNYVITFCP